MSCRAKPFSARICRSSPDSRPDKSGESERGRIPFDKSGGSRFFENDSAALLAEDDAARAVEVSPSNTSQSNGASADQLANAGMTVDAASEQLLDSAAKGSSIFFDKDGKEVKHRIFSVPHFGNTFPDQQDVQIQAANRYGVKPVRNRDEAEHSKGALVYVGSNPFFMLTNSIAVFLISFHVHRYCYRI